MVAAVTAVVVGVGGSDDAGRYDGGCGGLVTPTVAGSRVKTLTDPAVDGDVVLEELTSAVATTVGVRFTFKLSSVFLRA